MPIPVASLVQRAAFILQDEDHVRWTVPELIDWVNDAARETIVRRPAAGSVTKTVALAAGTRQALPDSGVQFLDIIRNVAPDGVTPGRVVRRVDRQLLDDQYPDWHSAKPATTVRHFAYDERSPQVFYVYPPVSAGVKIDLMYAEQPTTVSSTTDSLMMQDQYTNCLVEYMVYRALSKDSEFANGTVAALHYQAFVDAVTDNNAKTTANSPNQNSV